jgi:transposase
MASREGPLHVVTTERRYKDKVYQTHLLRRSYRENGKVKNETLGNISHLPTHLIDLISRSLKGESFVSVEKAFEAVSSPQHGQVHAVLRAMKLLDFEQLVASRPSRERDLVMAMVAARILEPKESKLSTTRWWHGTTLPELLGVSDADEDDLYAAMDWLLERQDRIEQKLAARHLKQDGLVLYDLSSSYFEGVTCPLAALGYNRDGKVGKLQVNYGMVTDESGRPVAVSVFEGNTSDGKTLMPQVLKAKQKFGLESFVLVGDRGMISQKLIDEHLRELQGVDWISALRSGAIGSLIEQKHLQLGLFDQRNLFEFSSPDYPGERFVACRNAELAKLRAHKRESLLQATVKELEEIRAMVERARQNKQQSKRKSEKKGRLLGADKIGLRVGKVINKYKVAKHFILDIGEDSFDFRIDEEKVAAEAALDGVYVVRTSLSRQRMSAEDTVRGYKSLCQVEQAFRCIKQVDLKVRPIRHHEENRVRAHIFLCMLAYYVEWHLLQAWRPLLFADEEQEAKKTRDPVAPAKRSESALRKVHSKRLDDGTEVHSFRTLLNLLAGIVRNVCRIPGAAAGEPTFHVTTTANAKQQRAYDLLEAIKVKM